MKLSNLKIISVLFILIYSSQALSQKIYINVGRAKIKKSVLALPQLKYFGSKSSNIKVIRTGQSLFKVIQNNLKVSGFFSLLGQDAFLENGQKVGLKPAPGETGGFDFNNWSAIGTEFLVRLGYSVTNNNIELEAYVYYVPQAKNLLAKKYKTDSKGLRKMAHHFSDDLVKALTGKPSMFRTKIVSTRNSRRGIKDIFVMDWDGANPKQITKSKTLALSPNWSPDGKELAFTQYAYHPKAKMRNPDLFKYELATGKTWLLSYRKGLNSGATYHPFKKEIYMTISRSGNPDIYKLNLRSESVSRITRGPNGALNLEPDVSPDGTRIAFSSTRSGRPMIYTMNLNGAGVKRLTYAGKYNSSPMWSPDGKKIVFAGMDRKYGNFDIFTINKSGTGLKRLTTAKKRNGRRANNEYPSYSPDGRYIMFTSNRTGKNQIYIILPDGSNERRITFDKHNYEMPKWGPFLKE